MQNGELERLVRAANFRSEVNEKLIKALLALLALKDEHLLAELRVLFDHAQRRGGEIGSASPEVWAGVNQQIDVLLNLVSDEDDDEIECKVANTH